MAFLRQPRVIQDRIFWLVSVFQRLGANVQARKSFVQTIQPAKEALSIEERIHPVRYSATEQVFCRVFIKPCEMIGFY